MFLIDRFGRPLTRLRISITNRCNLKCFYCHREGIAEEGEEASPKEIAIVVEEASKLGIRSVKLTGGEPLVREDVVEVVEGIAEVKGVSDLAMTTNGTLLGELAQDLSRAGLKRVNVNLPSIDPQTYREVTGGGDLRKVLDGIYAAKEAGLHPIKVNMVVLRGLNEAQVPQMLRFSTKLGLILQLIELEPAGNASSSELFYRYYVPLEEVIEPLEVKVESVEYRTFHKRKVLRLKDGGVLELVEPLENTNFCLQCMRLRMTPDLRFKPCLMREDNLVEIPKPLDRRSIREALIEANRRRAPFFTVERTTSEPFTRPPQ